MKVMYVQTHEKFNNIKTDFSIIEITITSYDFIDYPILLTIKGGIFNKQGLNVTGIFKNDEREAIYKCGFYARRNGSRPL